MIPALWRKRVETLVALFSGHLQAAIQIGHP